MERPSLRQLEYLVALAETLSFRRAAEACFVTQPALSTQIAKLETLLGAQLFERDRRHVLVTAEGREAVAHARRVLDGVDELARSVGASAGPLEGTLRLGVIPTVAPYVLPRALPVVHRRYPKLRLLLREERTPTLLQQLREGALDVLLLALEADLGELETQALYADPFVVACPPDHTFAKKKTVKQRDLDDAEVLLLEDGHCLRDQALSVCRLAGARETGDFRASSLGTLARMVAGGMGVTLLPTIALAVEARSKRELAVRPLVERTHSRTIGLAWRKASHRGEEFALLGAVLREMAPKGVTLVRG